MGNMDERLGIEGGESDRIPWVTRALKMLVRLEGKYFDILSSYWNTGRCC